MRESDLKRSIFVMFESATTLRDSYQFTRSIIDGQTMWLCHITAANGHRWQYGYVDTQFVLDTIGRGKHTTQYE